jgi:hypothetical protein
LAEILPELTEQAGNDPAKVVELARWLLSQRQSTKARDLIDGLPSSVKDSVLVKPIRFDLAVNRQDWPVVGELLRQGALGPIPAEAVRLAMEARTVGELKGEAARFAHWGKALDNTRTNIFGLRAFYQLGVSLKWAKEVEATLQAIARGFPGQTWAHEALVRVYTVEKNGAALQQIFTLWNQQAIGVTRIKHDSTLMDLLVFGAKAPAHVKKAAEELHKNEPSNPFYATTCALAYALDGRTNEALAVVAKLSAADRSNPARAPYLAFIYAKARKGDPLREQLALVRRETLLHEEAALADQAKVTLVEIDAEISEINKLIGGERNNEAVSPAPSNGPKS